MAGSDDKGPKKKGPRLRPLAEILAERRSRVAVPIPDEEDVPSSPERVSTPPPLPSGAETPELMAGLHDSTEEFTGEIDLLALSAPAQPAGQEAGDQKSTEDFTGEVEVIAAPATEPAEPPATINVSRRLYYILVGLAGAGSLVIAINIVMLVVLSIESWTSPDEVVLAQAEPGPAVEEPPPAEKPEPGPVVEEPPPAGEPEPPVLEPPPEELQPPGEPLPEPAPIVEEPPPPEPAPAVEEPPPPEPAPVVEKPVEKPVETPAVAKPRPKKAKKKQAAAPPAEPKPEPKVAKPKPAPAPAPEPKPVEKPAGPSKWELLI